MTAASSCPPIPDLEPSDPGRELSNPRQQPFSPSLRSLPQVLDPFRFRLESSLQIPERSRLRVESLQQEVRYLALRAGTLRFRVERLQQERGRLHGSEICWKGGGLSGNTAYTFGNRREEHGAGLGAAVASDIA